MHIETNQAQAAHHDPPNVTNPQHVDEDSIISPLQQVILFAVLFAITLLMVFSSYIPLGVGNTFLVLGGAVLKASLVLLFFMHMKSQSRLIQATVFAGLFVLSVLVVMSGSDYISRAWGMW